MSRTEMDFKIKNKKAYSQENKRILTELKESKRSGWKEKRQKGGFEKKKENQTVHKQTKYLHFLIIEFEAFLKSTMLN